MDHAKKVRFNETVKIFDQQNGKCAFATNGNQTSNKNLTIKSNHSFQGLAKNMTISLNKNDKENKVSKSSPSARVSAINYRLIHHLYIHYKEIAETTDGESSIDFYWPMITKDYNYVNFSEYSPDEIKNFWKRMPLMEKRKLELLQSSGESLASAKDTDQNNKKLKKSVSSSKKNDKLLTMVNYSLEDPQDQCQPFDLSKAQMTLDQSVQTENVFEMDCNELTNLAKEEYRLKISILKIRLEFMQKQFQKYFAQEI